jgi:hypothetical protein
MWGQSNFHHGPPWITVDHRESPWITVNHRGSPGITAAHDKYAPHMTGFQKLL